MISIEQQRQDAEQLAVKMFGDVPHIQIMEREWILNRIATEEQLMQLISVCSEIFEHVRYPSNEMTRLHQLKWVL